MMNSVYGQFTCDMIMTLESENNGQIYTRILEYSEIICHEVKVHSTYLNIIDLFQHVRVHKLII